MAMDPALRSVAILVLVVSFFTFLALFGQLPRFRKTPIGWAYRLFRYTIPRTFSRFDVFITGGKIGPLLRRFGRYLMFERHPIILVFYVLLVSGGTILFLRSGFPLLTVPERLLTCLLLPTPFLTLYLASTSNPGIITPSNHHLALSYYPYDNLNFPPRRLCRTCNLIKPARSKHCSICGHCIAKQDHHCAWLNNCIGALNTRWFLLFLITTNVYLLAGTIFSFICLSRCAMTEGMPFAGLDWGTSATVFWIVLVEKTELGAVFLLSTMCGFLAAAFTLYHTYLIWAGTTTNETSKWGDWKEDIKDGLVFIAEPESDNEGDDIPSSNSTASSSTAPSLDGLSDDDGESPTQLHHSSSSSSSILPVYTAKKKSNRARKSGKKKRSKKAKPKHQPLDGEYCHDWPKRMTQTIFRLDEEGGSTADLPRGRVWRRVERVEEMENLYDLGWRENIKEVVWPRRM